MKTCAVVLLMLLGAAACAETIVKKTHTEKEEKEETEVVGGWTILSPFFWIADRIPVAGPHITKFLHNIMAWIPPVMILPLTITTAVTAAWLFGMAHLLGRLLNHFAFKRALKATYSGPVTVSKEFWVWGGQGAQNTMTAFANSHLIPFLNKQGGLTRYAVYRSLGCSNHWCAVSEWATLEDYRKAWCSPEANTLRSHLPWSVWFYGMRKYISAPHLASAPVRSGESSSTARRVVA
jgi:hypothetical protein